MGKIKDWRQLGCLARKLTWVCQSDGCGTSKPFAKSIEAFSREWVLKVGRLIRYPTAISAKNNLGTTDSVQNTKSSIDYISCPKGSVKVVANQNKTNSKSLNISKLDANLASRNRNYKVKSAYLMVNLTQAPAYGPGKSTDLFPAQDLHAGHQGPSLHPWPCRSQRQCS